MTGTARHIAALPDWDTKAALYFLTPPFRGQEYVAVSGFRTSHEGQPQADVCAYASDPNGQIGLDGEPIVAVRGTDSHARMLAQMGYRIVHSGVTGG